MGFPLTPRSMTVDDLELLYTVKFSWNFASFHFSCFGGNKY